MNPTRQRVSTPAASPRSSADPFSDFIGLRWLPHGRSRAGVDCWGLVWLFYLEAMAIQLPSGGALYNDPRDREECARVIAGGVPDWRLVAEAEAQPGDVVLLSRHRLPCHVGILARRGWLLHVRDGTASCQVPIERTAREGYAVVGYYRHRERA